MHRFLLGSAPAGNRLGCSAKFFGSSWNSLGSAGKKFRSARNRSGSSWNFFGFAENSGFFFFERRIGNYDSFPLRFRRYHRSFLLLLLLLLFLFRMWIDLETLLRNWIRVIMFQDRPRRGFKVKHLAGWFRPASGFKFGVSSRLKDWRRTKTSPGAMHRLRHRNSGRRSIVGQHSRMLIHRK